MRAIRALRLIWNRLATGRPPVGLAMNDALSAAYEWPKAMNFDVDGPDRLVCVSDLHRGKRNGADDHRRAERVYNAALQWYFRHGYTLAILGDAEDFWEADPDRVLVPPNELKDGARDARGYLRSLELEALFNHAGRYIRIYGNHDGRYRNSNLVQQALGPFFQDEQHPIRVHEAVRVPLGGPTADRLATSGPRPSLLLVHGHQGDLFSDILAPQSSWMVRCWSWFQAKVGAFTALPSEDASLRNNTSKALYQWALTTPQHPVLIAGHTHEPVFATSLRTPPPTSDRWAQVEDRLRATTGSDPASIQEAVKLELMLGEFRRQLELKESQPQDHPCYFNTGACCYGDGQISALEIADGSIRLVRWAFHAEQSDSPTLERLCQQRSLWADVLEQVYGGQLHTPIEPPPFDMKEPEFLDRVQEELATSDPRAGSPNIARSAEGTVASGSLPTPPALLRSPG